MSVLQQESIISSRDTIARKLKDLGFRLRWVSLVEGTAAGIALLVVLFIGGGLLVSVMSGWSGLIFRLAVLLIMAAVVVRFIIRPLVSRQAEDFLALKLEQTYPDLSNSVISSVQLSREINLPHPKSPFSHALYERLMESTAERIRGLSLLPVAPLDKAKKFLAAMMITVCLAAVLIGLRPALLHRAFQSLVLNDFNVTGASPQDVKAALALTIGDFTVNYVYPAYTGFEPHQVSHTTGDLAGIKGTEVTIETEVLEKVKEATLVIGSATRIPLSVSDNRLLKGKIALMEQGEYFIEARDKSGSYRVEPVTHHIVVDEDQSPEIVVDQPVEDMEVSAEDTVEIEYHASDDFGLSSIDLVYWIGDNEKRIPLFSARDQNPHNIRDGYELVIADIGAKPEDRVAYYLEAKDNDSVAGGKTARSQTRYLDVFSARRKHQQLLERQEALFRDMLDHLATHLEDDIALAKSPKDYNLVKSESALIDAGKKIVGSIQGILADWGQDPYGEELVRTSLEQMEGKYTNLLASRSQALSALIQALNNAGRQPEKSVLGLRPDYIEELENDIIFLDKLVKKQKINDILDEAKDLYQAQANLADLIEQYKKTKDPALLEKLKQTMAQLQQAFEDLMTRLAKMRKDLPDEFVNAESRSKVDYSDIFDQMQKLNNSLQDGDMDNALKMAEDFLKNLDQMMSALEKSSDEYGDAVAEEAKKRMNEMIDQLAALEQTQQELINETEEINRQTLESEMQRMQEALKSFAEKERDKIDSLQHDIDALRNNLAMMQEKSGNQIDFRNLMQDRMMMEQKLNSAQTNLQRSKERMDSQEAQEMMKELNQSKDNLEAAKKMAEQLPNKYKTGPKEETEKVIGQCSGAVGKNDEIIKDWESMMNSDKGQPRSAASSGNQKRLSEMADKQDKIQSEIEQMQARLQSLSQDVPGLPMEVQGMLGEASGHMNDASGELRMSQSSRALPPERDAQSQMRSARQTLEDFQKQLGQCMNPGNGMPSPGMGMGMGRGKGRPGRRGETGQMGYSSKDFKLPDQDSYQVPEAFRQDILKAMKDGSPEEYKNLNKDYYDRLVR